MKRILTIISMAVVIAALGAPPAAIAQEKTASYVPLKVQLVLSRYKGEKKISSLPYTLWVTANQMNKTSLRMGVEVPVPSTMFTTGPNKEQVPIASYSYRSVGTNIDCTATSTGEGTFSVSITLSDSAIQFEKEAGAPRPSNQPAFRNFTANFIILLKDGQTAQYTTATDPVSGEVLKVDATLNVLK